MTISCGKSDLEIALDLAGDNAGELRKVLDFYSQKASDSLKYRAAVFLIENMPGHYSLGGKNVEAFYKSVDSLLLKERDKEKLRCKIDSVAMHYDLPDEAVRLEDVRHVTASFLIQNIERAFEVWPNGGYSHHLTFDQFCEFILPYRIGNEPLEFWRDSLKNEYNDIRSHGYSEGWRYSAFHACCELNNRLRNETGVTLIPITVFPIEKYSTLKRLPIGDCSYYCSRAMFAMRAKGIPVVEDFTPQWPYQALGHTWNVLLCNNGNELTFGGVDTNPDIVHKADSKLAKVYRKYFKKNKYSLAAVCGREAIPSELSSPFIYDVTSSYINTCDLSVDIAVRPQQTHKYAYLCVFDNKNWRPITSARVRWRKAVFSEMGKNIMYLPAFYVGGKMQAANYPFEVGYNGKIRYYNPDTVHTYNLRLYRKYPTTFRVIGVTSHMVGGEIQAADNPEFKNPKIFHRIKKNPNGFYISVVSDTIWRKYKYWRHLSPKGGYGNIAELQFFDEKNNLLNSFGKIIGTEGSWGNDPHRAKESAFDGDPLTFFDSSVADSAWVGLEFPEPVSVKKVIFLPRNDGNNVTIGEDYELFYFSVEGWKSLGRKVAQDYYVEFANVPRNAVLWLLNHTQGNEERIFTFDGKNTYWW